MAETVQITLTAKDGTTQVFKASGAAAERMGDQVEAAGKRGARSLIDAEKAGRALGSGLAVLGLASVKLGADQERLAYALTRNYGDAAAEFQAFADKIQNTTIFSDDMVIEGANVAAQLSRNFQFTNEQIQEVITTAANLASLYGTDLASAVDRVVAGLRGEAESAEMIGLSLGDSSTGIDKMSASLSEAEKAQIRFTALQEQAVYATGAAADVADQSGQAWHRWANTTQDALQGIGTELSEYQSLIIAAGAATQVLGPAGDLFTAFGGKAKAAQIGAAALSLATGPVGLAAAAIAGGVAIYALTQRQTDAEATTEALAAATANYTQTIIDNTTALVGAGLYDQADATQDYLSTLETNGGIAAARIEQVTSAMSELQEITDAGRLNSGTLVTAEDLALTDAHVVGLLEMNGALQDGYVSMDELKGVQAQLAAGFVLTGDQAAKLKTQVSGLTDELLDPELAGSEIQAEITNILTSLEAGTITFDQASTALQGLEDDTTTYNLALREEAAAVDAAAAAYERFEARRGDRSHMVSKPDPQFERNLRNMEEQGAAEEASAAARERRLVLEAQAEGQRTRARQESADAMGDHQEAMDAERAAASASARSYYEADKALGGLTDSYGVAVGATLNLTEAQQGGINARQIEIATTERLTATREKAAAAAEAEAQAVLAATQSYADMVGTTNALDSGISVVIGGLDKLGGGVEKVKTELEGLVGVQGEWGTIDDMLAAGLITWDQYNAAVAASYSVTQDAASSQDWMNTILANQAPLMADLVSGQENYIEGISRLSADEQLLALAYMDSAEAGKALELQTLAISAANGELGEGGGKFAAEIIEGAAQADPILKAMLVDMELISVDREGNITVNMDGDGVSEMEALTNSVDALTIALGGVPPVRLTVDDSEVVNYTPPETAFEWPVNLKIGGGEGGASAVDQLLAFGGVEPDPVVVPISADAAQAQAELDAWVATVGATKPTVEVEGGTGRATTALGQFLLDVGAATPVLNIGGDASGATGAADGAVGYVGGLLGTIAIGADASGYYNGLPPTGQVIGTNYIDVVTRTGITSGAGFIGFATGGSVTARMGEVGPEAVTIPGSAMRAIAPRDGLYTVPEGSYVSPAVATRGMGGGGGGGMNFAGATIYVVASTPDIHDALNGQLLAQGRR